ncbi:MAG: carboxypeptidase regulatory-like domain-containing protein [Acidobacteriota bacterium]|nr:carboxypeptidase regulatory-like domain-containing protein [Acidobacteriota bacterium]
MASHIGVKYCSLLALLLVAQAGALVCAQTGLGALAGRLTDSQAHPLSDVTVIARNQSTGVEMRTIASHNGSYEFKDLPPGPYSLHAISSTLGQGEIEGILVSPHHTAHVQVALNMAPVAMHTSSSVEAATQPQASHLPVPARIDPQSSASTVALAHAPIATLGPPARPLPQASPTAAMEIVLPQKPRIDTQALPEIIAPLQPFRGDTRLVLAESSIPAHPAAPRAAFVASQGPSIEPALDTVAILLSPTDQRAALHMPALGSLPVAPYALTAPRMQAAIGSTRLMFAGPFMIQVAMGAARAALRLTAVPPGSLLAVAQAGLENDDASDVLTAEQLQSLPMRDGDVQRVVAGGAGSLGDDSEQSNNATPGSSPTEVSMNGVTSRFAFQGNNLTSPGRGHSYYDGPISPQSAIRAVRILSPNRVSGDRQFLGGSIAMESRHGGVGIHGQLSLYARQDLFQAQNPFAQWIRESAPASYAAIPSFTAEPFSPSSHNLRGGAGVGGQFHYGRFGWFVSADASHRSEPAVATVREADTFFARPTNDQMQVLSARLALSGVDPVAEGLAAYSPVLEQIAGLLGPTPRSSTRITGFGRVDWRLSDRQSIAVVLSDSYWNSPGGGLSRTSEFYGSHSFGSYRGDEQWVTGQWRGFLTPNLMLVTQGSFGRYRHLAPPPVPSAFEQSFNISTWNRLPQIIIDSRYGFTMGSPSRFGPGSYPDESNIDLRQQVDWARGQFLLSAGFEFRHSMDSSSLLANQAGTYQYASVENFISDVLSFAHFGLTGQLNPYDQHNCDETGTVWRDSYGQLHGLGYLPCYSTYSQTIGPSDWWLATNDWAGSAAARWQPARHMTVAVSMRWQHEQLPPPIAAIDNPDLPGTERTPTLGNDWAPSFSLAWGRGESLIPVLRVGYGMFYGRTANLTFLSALTQTGSLNGDVDYVLRPTDNLYNGGAPPFPYVLSGAPGTTVKPGAVEFASSYRNPEVHQAAVSLEESLPARFHLEAGASVALGRRLPTTIDANVDPAINPQTITYQVVDFTQQGPIKMPTVTVPFYGYTPSAFGTMGRLYPGYQRILQIQSRANSSWQAGSLQLSRNSRTFTLRVRYTYSHAWDWNPDGSPTLGTPSVFDPSNLRLDYGPGNLDARHFVSGFFLWQTNFHLSGVLSRIANGWLLASTGTFRSGLPYSMRTAGVLPKQFVNHSAIVEGLSYGMNGSGGARFVYGVGRNTYRYQPTWNANLRLARKFDLGALRQLEILAESFNFFNHSNVTQVETVGYTISAGTQAGGLPTLTFLNGIRTGQTAFGNTLSANATNYYRPRELQFGLIFRF